MHPTLPFANTRILLADDNPVNQIVASLMLQKYGCMVMTANDGLDAVNQLAQEPFDLVFMDCQMPGMDGFEATAAIRTHEQQQRIARIPIIALTGNALAGDDAKCYAAGMDDYVVKPIQPEDIERVLTRWLERMGKKL